MKPKNSEPLHKTPCTTLTLLMAVECIKYLIIEPCTNEVLGPPQVHSTSKKLLYQLDHLVQICNQPGMEQTTRKHVGKSFSLTAMWRPLHLELSPVCYYLWLGCSKLGCSKLSSKGLILLMDGPNSRSEWM